MYYYLSKGLLAWVNNMVSQINSKPISTRMKGNFMSIENIKEGVSHLSVKEQAALVYWIIDNLDTVAEHEDVVDAAWRKEVRARVEAIKSGKVQMIAAEEMWKDILGNYVKTS